MTKDDVINAYKNNWDFLVRYCKWQRYLRHDTAEDVVQDVFENVWVMFNKGETIENFHNPGAVRAYLIRAVENRCNDLIRENKAKKRGGPDVHHVDYDDTVEDTSHILPSTFLTDDRKKKLSKMESDCFELREKGYTYKDIGNALGISTSTAKTHVRRMREKANK